MQRLGAHPKRLATLALSRPAANTPAASVSRSVSSGQCEEVAAAEVLKHARRDPGTEDCLTTSDYPRTAATLVRSG